MLPGPELQCNAAPMPPVSSAAALKAGGGAALHRRPDPDNSVLLPAIGMPLLPSPSPPPGSSVLTSALPTAGAPPVESMGQLRPLHWCHILSWAEAAVPALKHHGTGYKRVTLWLRTP